MKMLAQGAVFGGLAVLVAGGVVAFCGACIIRSALEHMDRGR